MRWFLIAIFSVCLPLARADIADAEESARKFETPPGFKVEVVAAEPQVMNPVAFSMNEKGQIYVAETYRLDNAVVDITKNTNWLRDDLSFRTPQERARFLPGAFGTNAYMLTNKTEKLRMLEDTNHDGTIDRSVWVRGGFRQPASGLAAGVLARGNKVWFACIPDLWRYENLDDPQETVTRLLSTGYGVHIGVTGHDLHGLTLGMDGKLYFSIGDRGLMVRNANGDLNYPDTGSVLRCNQDGSELEVYATGFRNPQELTFDELGNLWTADNDTAGEDKCRLIYVVEGADYGWRCSYQHMKGFGPWVQENLWAGGLDGVLPSCGDPGQGPAGFAYNPGSGLPAEYNGRFFLCDFPGGIQTFAVEPKGASYVIKDRKHFLWNAWPTDVEFGTDGALYFSDWVGGWSLPNKGRIYRVTHSDAESATRTAATAAAFQGGIDDKDIPTLLKLLEHHDLRVRQTAHLALSHKRDAAAPMRALATDTSKPRAPRMHAIWALRIQGSLLPDTLEKLLADKDAEIRANAVRAAATPAILAALKDESPRVRFAAANALQKKLLFDAAATTTVDAIFEMLEKNAGEDPYLTHAGARVLTMSQPALVRARKHPALAVRRAGMIAERYLAVPGIGNYLRDADLRYEAARAINDVPIPAAYPQLGAMLTNGCPTNILSRAINANYRYGGLTAARRLASFALNTNWPASFRADALECLSDWQDPDELDRIMMLWWPVKADLEKRNETFATRALQTNLPALLFDKEPVVTLAALKCIDNLELTDQASNVLAIFRAPERSAVVRAGALRTLDGIDDTNYPAALESALQDPTLRIEALGLIKTNTSEEVMSRVVAMTDKEQDLPTVRALYRAIRHSTTTNATEALKTQLTRLGKKEVPPELALDLMETARKYDLTNEVETAVKAAFADPATDPLLAGGDAAEGRRVFEDRSDVACMRCHSLNGKGGTVGPPLDGIGARQAKTNILESILLPNKEIAKGYDTLILSMLNGRTYVGKPTQETTIDLVLDSPEDGPVHIRKADVREVARVQSAMPEGLGDLLGPLDLRNLLEFLSSLK